MFIQQIIGNVAAAGESFGKSIYAQFGLSREETQKRKTVTAIRVEKGDVVYNAAKDMLSEFNKKLQGKITDAGVDSDVEENSLATYNQWVVNCLSDLISKSIVTEPWVKKQIENGNLPAKATTSANDDSEVESVDLDW